MAHQQPAAPAANPNIGAQLGQHDLTKRATELPLYYGNKDRETCTALYLAKRLENAAVIGNWNDQRKCQEFYATLRDKALKWWDNLGTHGIDIQNWDQVKEAFLRVYEPRYSAKVTCTNLSDLTQKPNEGVHDFYLRVVDSCRKLFLSRPDNLKAVRMALPVGLTDANARRIKLEGLEDDEMYIKHQIFIGGLREEFRSKVIEANKANLGESVYFAVDLETVLNEKKMKIGVATISEEFLTEEERNAVNAIRHKNFGNKNNKRTPPKATGSTICRYCKKNGHFQKDCRSRIRDKAPMVDAQGKAYRKVNAVTEGDVKEEKEEWEPEDSEGKIGSISQTTPASLNWY
jgi:hypothetical protein